MKVFSRDGGHPADYPPVFDEWLAGESVLPRAVARNLMHDHRVTQARATRFDAFVTRPCSRAAFEKGLRDYQARQVREANPPDFADDRLNRINLLSGISTGTHIISKDVDLVRVLDLSALTFVYDWAQRALGGTFGSFDAATSDSIGCWLDRKMLRPRDFIVDVLAMLREYQARVHAFHPTWATTWDAFAPYLRQGPERWVQAVGVERPAGHWLILLRYRVRDVGSLARPTQLDAGWYAYHFPSPPQVAASRGGHPVDLDSGADVPLLPEFIHEQIPHSIEHWEAAGGSYGKTSRGSVLDCVDARQQHYHRLLAAYGNDVLGWMPTPI